MSNTWWIVGCLVLGACFPPDRPDVRGRDGGPPTVTTSDSAVDTGYETDSDSGF